MGDSATGARGLTSSSSASADWHSCLSTSCSHVRTSSCATSTRLCTRRLRGDISSTPLDRNSSARSSSAKSGAEGLGVGSPNADASERGLWPEENAQNELSPSGAKTKTSGMAGTASESLDVVAGTLGAT